MHVCHVNLARGFRGGERQTELLIRALDRGGLQQTLVARYGEPLLERLADLDSLDKRPIRQPFWLRHSQLCGDIVHAHENKAAHLASLHRRRGGPPYLITRRVDNPPGTGAATRRMYRRASRLVAISSAIANILRAYDASLQTTIIPSALGILASSPEGVAELRRRWSGKTVIGHIGALDNAQKGQLYLIRAMHEVVRRYPDAHCVLLGSGKDEAWFRQEAQGLSCIEFAGHVHNVGDYLTAFDLFAFPSLHEGLGSSLLDAMDFSLPIVASGVDGIPDIVHDGENGLLVPAADSEALAGAIGRLLEDTALRQRLGEAGKKLSRNYHPDIMAASYTGIYRELMNERD